MPNVANIVVRLMLLFGQFNYQQRGILDKTHLRFFTRKSARRLLEENGYAIEQERETVIPIELVLGWSEKNIVLRLMNRLLAAATWLLPGFFGYQIMFVARSTHRDNARLSSHTRRQAQGKQLRKTSLHNLLLRGLDIVGHPAERHQPRFRIVQRVSRPGIAIARLPHRSRIQHVVDIVL